MPNEKLPSNFPDQPKTNEHEAIAPSQRWQQMLEDIKTLIPSNSSWSKNNLSAEQMLRTSQKKLPPGVMGMAIFGPRQYLALYFGENNLCEQACQLIERTYDQFNFSEEPTSQNEKIETAMTQFSLAQTVKTFISDENLDEKTKSFLKLIFDPNNFQGKKLDKSSTRTGRFIFPSAVGGLMMDYSKKGQFLGQAFDMFQEKIITPRFPNVELWSEENFGKWKQSELAKPFSVELTQLEQNIVSQDPETLSLVEYGAIVLTYPQPDLLISVIDRAAAHCSDVDPRSRELEAREVLKIMTSQKNWKQAKDSLLAVYPDLSQVISLIEKHDFGPDMFIDAIIQFDDKLGRHEELQNNALSPREQVSRQYPDLKIILELVDKTKESLPPYLIDEFVTIQVQMTDLDRAWGLGDPKTGLIDEEISKASLIKRNLGYVSDFIIDELTRFKPINEDKKEAILRTANWLESKISSQDWDFFVQHSEFYKKIEKRLREELTKSEQKKQ